MKKKRSAPQRAWFKAILCCLAIPFSAMPAFACGWEYHVRMTETALVKAGFSPENIGMVIEGNISADCEEIDLLPAHFCSELHAAGSERLRQKMAAVTENIKMGNKPLALRDLGKMMHALQDFYCHSNFVENDPNAEIDLFHLADPSPEEKCDPVTLKGPLTTPYWPDNKTPPGKCSHEQMRKDHPEHRPSSFEMVQTRGLKETEALLAKFQASLSKEHFEALKTFQEEDLGGAITLYDWPANKAKDGYPNSLSKEIPALAGLQIDAILKFDEEIAFIFEGDHYYAFNIVSKTIQAGYPRKISHGWPRMSFTDGVDAAIRIGEKIYFFKGPRYSKFSLKTFRQDSKYPRPIAERWKGVFPDRVDEALVWGDKVYFFKGHEYSRYDLKAKAVEKNYPIAIGDTWSGVWMDGLDAVLAISPTEVYFFQNKPIKPIPK